MAAVLIAPSNETLLPPVMRNGGEERPSYATTTTVGRAIHHVTGRFWNSLFRSRQISCPSSVFNFLRRGSTCDWWVGLSNLFTLAENKASCCIVMQLRRPQKMDTMSVDDGHRSRPSIVALALRPALRDVSTSPTTSSACTRLAFVPPFTGRLTPK